MSVETFSHLLPNAGIFELFEQSYPDPCLWSTQSFKQKNYDLASVLEYIDSLRQLHTLVYNSHIRAYEPYHKEWIKRNMVAWFGASKKRSIGVRIPVSELAIESVAM